MEPHNRQQHGLIAFLLEQMVFMDTGLRGKTALITGGSSGIGLGIAQVLASEGVDVAVASRKPDQAVVDQLKSQGSNALGITADVTCESDVAAMFCEAIDTFTSSTPSTLRAAPSILAAQDAQSMPVT